MVFTGFVFFSVVLSAARLSVDSQSQLLIMGKWFPIYLFVMYRHSRFGVNPNDSLANDHIFGQSCFGLFVISNVYSSSYLCLFELYKCAMSRCCGRLVSCNILATTEI
jgi:hypothetical protein